ncbi:MAG: nucleotidyltransferase family protein [Acidimicrobiales bacterium]
MLAVDAFVPAVAASGLAGSRIAVPTRPLESSEWTPLLAAVRAQRLTGMLARTLANGAFPVTPAQRDDVRRAEMEAARVALFLDRVLIDVSDRLRAAEIEHRVLKGAALAHTMYPDPAMRHYGDVDVLVRGSRLDDAVSVLLGAGGIRRYQEPRPGFLARFGKGVAIVRPDGFEVDIHRTFVSGPLGLTIQLDDLFATETRFSLAGRTVLGLGREEAFIQTCYHAALGSTPPRMVPLRDVVQLALFSDLDTDRVQRLCVRWRAHAVVAKALRLAWKEFDLADSTGLSAWAKAYRPTRRERHMLRAYESNTDRYARQAAAALMTVPGVRARAAYGLAMLLPSRPYLDERDGRYLKRLRRGVRTARHTEIGR